MSLTKSKEKQISVSRFSKDRSNMQYRKTVPVLLEIFNNKQKVIGLKRLFIPSHYKVAHLVKKLRHSMKLSPNNTCHVLLSKLQKPLLMSESFEKLHHNFKDKNGTIHLSVVKQTNFGCCPRNKIVQNDYNPDEPIDGDDVEDDIDEDHVMEIYAQVDVAPAALASTVNLNLVSITTHPLGGADLPVPTHIAQLIMQHMGAPSPPGGGHPPSVAQGVPTAFATTPVTVPLHPVQSSPGSVPGAQSAPAGGSGHGHASASASGNQNAPPIALLQIAVPSNALATGPVQVQVTNVGCAPNTVMASVVAGDVTLACVPQPQITVCSEAGPGQVYVSASVDQNVPAGAPRQIPVSQTAPGSVQGHVTTGCTPPSAVASVASHRQESATASVDLNASAGDASQVMIAAFETAVCGDAADGQVSTAASVDQGTQTGDSTHRQVVSATASTLHNASAGEAAAHVQVAASLNALGSETTPGQFSATTSAAPDLSSNAGLEQAPETASAALRSDLSKGQINNASSIAQGGSSGDVHVVGAAAAMQEKSGDGAIHGQVVVGEGPHSLCGSLSGDAQDGTVSAFNLLSSAPEAALRVTSSSQGAVNTAGHSASSSILPEDAAGVKSAALLSVTGEQLAATSCGHQDVPDVVAVRT